MAFGTKNDEPSGEKRGLTISGIPRPHLTMQGKAKSEAREGAGGVADSGLASDEKSGRSKKKGWCGILTGGDRFFNFTCAIAMLVILASLTFMQLGFIGIGNDGNYLAYIMTPLAFVAAGALLFGAGRGMLFGLAAGIILFIHASIQPLDVYERFLVGPMNSIVLLGFCGLCTGLLFKIALRNDPKGLRRILYIAICCFISAIVEQACFLINGVIDLFISVAAGDYVMFGGLSDASDGAQSSQLWGILGSLGKSLGQLPFNFLLMLGACIFALWVANERKKPAESRALHTVFQTWLLVVVITAHMATSAFSFVINTEASKKSAFESMRGEIEYLIGQLQERSNNEEIIIGFLDEAINAGYVPSDTMRKKFEGLTGIDTIIGGYEKEADGTIVIYAGDGVYATDDDRYPEGSSMTEDFGSRAKELMASLSESGKAQELLYDRDSVTIRRTGAGADDIEMTVSDEFSTQISYMMAGQWEGFTVMIEKPSSMVFSNRALTMTLSSLSVLVLLGAVYLLVAGLLKRVVTDQMDKMNDGLGNITGGNLEQRVDVRSSREFVALSDGINTTVDALKGWIIEAETRMATELATAKAIQESNLPRTFPPFPEIDRFDIFASMNPAKEVGGDFFDFFLIDDHTLGFLIADVSGKGIPGALFMMAAKGELELHMQTGMSIEQAIAGTNARLCANNDADMFVTVWAATLDYRTGELTYVNAGHNPPLLRHNGRWEWLKKKGGLFLGTFPTAKYRSNKLTLEEGDEIMLYTDGVNEAFSANGEEYGNDRLESFLQNHADEHPRMLVEDLRADVAKWAEGAEQSDDITMVCLEYGVAPEVSGTATYVATLDNLGAMMKPIQTELSERLCPIDVQHKIEIALEEMLVNVCRYAYADAEEPGKVQVSYVYNGNPSSIAIELRDWGVPFDPMTRKDPTKPANIQEAKIGGLGIFMTKKSVDDMSYLRDGDSNVVAFSKSW